MRAFLVVFAAVGAVSCTRARLPMTAGQLAAIGDGAGALSLYLRQEDADPGVCDAASGRGVLPPGETVGRQLVGALREGRVSRETWRACAEAILRDGDRARGEDLLAWILGAATDILSRHAVETDAEVRAQLSVLEDVYAGHDAGPVASASRRERALREVESVLAFDAPRAVGSGGPRDVRTRRPGPAAVEEARRLAAALGAERGEWQGQPVDRAVLERMQSTGDEPSLELLGRRLPDPALRAEAERALVALRIARSPFPEVRASAAEVQDAVLRTGTNAVSRPPSSASLAGDVLRAAHVRVEQDLGRGTATLRNFVREGPVASRLTALPLRGALTFEVAGLSRPVTLCPSGRALDPTPCIFAAAVSATTPLARVGGDGALRLAEGIPAASAVGLARAGGHLEVPLAVGGAVVATPSWPVAYARPADLVLEGARPGARGPDLQVDVERVGSRLIYTVAEARAAIEAAVEWGDASAFRIVTRGARGGDGSDGHDGMDGTSGLSGSSASCGPSGGHAASDGGRGGDGGSGGNGQDGGDGGRGGDVRVRVRASAAEQRDETLALLRATISSEGGPGGKGGDGGRGGRGGRGGSGGSGTYCSFSDGRSESLSSGSSGPDGQDGSDGWDGRDGSGGSPGTVTFEVGSPPVAAARIRPGRELTH